MDEIEKSIANHPSIKKVNTYCDIAGNVCVEIIQRNPIARVVTTNNSFYIDENGKHMPLSKVYTARTLVITGEVHFTEKGELFLLAKFIDENPFWKAQIMQIDIEENGDLILIPRVGYQEIVFGKPVNIAQKFNKLKLFYEKGISEKGWNNYSHINLKFKNQIVCTKK
jgi:cell division protein FtsQ